MRLPAVMLAASFAAGTLLGALLAGADALSPAHTLAFLFIACAVAVSAGLIFLRLGFLRAAGALSLSAWLLLGFTAARIARQPRPDDVLAVLAAREIDMRAPVRWQGVLQDEPVHFPWGVGYELTLQSIILGDEAVPVSGGLRLSFYSGERADSPGALRPQEPDAHAGDSVEVLAKAHLPKQFKNPGSFDRRGYLHRQEIDLLGTLRDSQLLRHLDSPPPSLWHRLARFRCLLRQRLDALLAPWPAESGLLHAMLLGDRSYVDGAEAAAFQKTGTYHILVVAGLHVTALVVFVYWLCRRLRLPLGTTVFLALLLLAAYVAVVEDRPPIFRAALMAAVVLLGRLLYRRLDLLNSAATAALVILIVRPLAIADSSFQLSFLAMAAIGGIAVPWLTQTVEPFVRALPHLADAERDLGYTPRQAQFRIELRWAAHWLSRRLPARAARFAGLAVALPVRLALRFWELFAVSLVLQLAMLPLLVLDFHRVALAAPFANVPAVTLTSLLVPLGFLTLFLSFLWTGLARFLAAPLAFALHFLIRMTDWFAALPRLSYRIPAPPLWLTAAFFLLLLAVMVALRLRGRWAVYALIPPLLLAAYLLAACPFAPQYAHGKLEMTAVDVGQGDSIFVVSPHGQTMLVDGGGSVAGFSERVAGSGPDPGEEAVSPYLWSRHFQHVDIVALTHPHQDHIGGLRAVLQNFSVGALWIGREVDIASLRDLEGEARAAGIPVVHQRQGAVFAWDGVREDTLWPDVPPEDVAPAVRDNDSLVFRLTFGREAFLLTGDLEKQSEHSILAAAEGHSLQADVLKVGHHGSKNSSSPEFLEAVSPRVAVISAGEDNPYGHPSPEALDRLEAYGARVFRTDRDGTVQVLTDGQSLSVSCFVSCPAGLERTLIRNGEKVASMAAPPHQQPEDSNH